MDKKYTVTYKVAPMGSNLFIGLIKESTTRAILVANLVGISVKWRKRREAKLGFCNQRMVNLLPQGK
ncbi:hypothetical protein [Arsenophonus apicola]|uniref:Uncharacterized protein n=1 Tax=Arsenophonus apicola TaxID=2879119 RepID=A0ABY8P155_9GAMM|nr:hypothetical protein [Arsenophonus apicola]WGO83217.1 hypothetical protein QG404_12875 [Arsenophonus apicola]